MAHEIAGFTRHCQRHGQYIGGVGSCPCCAGVQKPPPPPWRQGSLREREADIERGLRQRCPSGPVDETGHTEGLIG